MDRDSGPDEHGSWNRRGVMQFAFSPLSLTIRLYANMFAGEEVTLVFFSLVPIGIPIIFMALHLGVALIQAYIFMLLTMMYVAGAVVHEH